MYHVILVLGVQKRDSVIHTYICIFASILFSIIGDYTVLVMVPRAMQ